MNGRMLSRAIHSTSPATMVADDRARRRAARAARTAIRPGRPFGLTNGGGGRRGHPARPADATGPSATGGAGSSMVPQTTRRGIRLRPRRAVDARGPRPFRASAGGSSSPATPSARGSAGRELADAWDARSTARDCRVHRPTGKSRRPVAFGAPVPAAIALERELADIVLTELVSSLAGPRGARGRPCPRAGG